MYHLIMLLFSYKLLFCSIALFNFLLSLLLSLLVNQFLFLYYYNFFSSYRSISLCNFSIIKLLLLSLFVVALFFFAPSITLRASIVECFQKSKYLSPFLIFFFLTKTTLESGKGNTFCNYSALCSIRVPIFYLGSYVLIFLPSCLRIKNQNSNIQMVYSLYQLLAVAPPSFACIHKKEG